MLLPIDESVCFYYLMLTFVQNKFEVCPLLDDRQMTCHILKPSNYLHTCKLDILDKEIGMDMHRTSLLFNYSRTHTTTAAQEMCPVLFYDLLSQPKINMCIKLGWLSSNRSVISNGNWYQSLYGCLKKISEFVRYRMKIGCWSLMINWRSHSELQRQNNRQVQNFYNWFCFLIRCIDLAHAYSISLK